MVAKIQLISCGAHKETIFKEINKLNLFYCVLFLIAMKINIKNNNFLMKNIKSNKSFYKTSAYQYDKFNKAND